MKTIFITVFAIVLAILPLQSDIILKISLNSLAGNETDLLLGLLLITFYVYTIFNQSTKIPFYYLLIPIILTSLLILTAFTGLLQPPNALTIFQLLIVIWLIPFIQFLLEKFNWQILALISIGILILHAQWGLSQFIIQESLGLSVLGETRLSQIDTTGIATINFNSDTKLIRAYGPYAHSNSLSGSLLIGLLLSIFTITHLRKLKLEQLITDSDSRHTTAFNHSKELPLYNTLLKFFPLMMLTILLGIIATLSRAAIISVILCIPILFAQKRLLPDWFLKQITLIFIITTLTFLPIFIPRYTDPQDVAAPERLTGYIWSTDIMIKENNWRHVGPGQYEEALTTYLDNTNISYLPWQIAPVHSVPLLFITEWGVISVFFILLLFLIIALKYPINKIVSYLFWTIPLIPILLLDHYLLTQTAPLVWLLVLLMIFHQALLKGYEIDLKNRFSD